MGIQFRGGAYAGLIADLGSIHSTIERKKEKKRILDSRKNSRDLGTEGTCSSFSLPGAAIISSG